MRATDHASRHFDEMSRFTMRLAELPAQVLKYTYSYATAGSWSLTFRHRTRTFRLSYDGRAQEHVLERSSTRHSPHDWVAVWREASLNTEPPPEILDVIVDATSDG
jgi:hypothetical protein